MGTKDAAVAIAVGGKEDTIATIDSLVGIVGASVAAVLLSSLRAAVGALVAVDVKDAIVVGASVARSSFILSSKQYSNSGSSSSSVGQS